MDRKAPKRKPLTLTAYAEHRGVSQSTVSRAIETGRLRDSVEESPNGRPVIVDVALADQESDDDDGPASGVGVLITGSVVTAGAARSLFGKEPQ